MCMAIKRKLRVQFGAAGARLRMCESSIEEKQGYEVLKVVGSQKCCHVRYDRKSWRHCQSSGYLVLIQ